MEKPEVVKCFLASTKRIIKVLESKLVLTKSEEYELDACRGDIKRANRYLKGKNNDNKK